jgi:integrase
MTGTLTTKKDYYYIKLSYKEPVSHKWKQKMIATHLSVKGNKRKAESLKNEALVNYAYLENLPAEYNAAVDPNITLCDYLDNWLYRKKSELERSTYESYEYRASKITNYFKATNPHLKDITAGTIDKFMSYLLQYGKTNQKTGQKEPLAVRTVRSIKSILLSVFKQAVIDGLMTSNPVLPVSVHGKKNKEFQEDLLFLTETECSDLINFLANNEKPHFHKLAAISFFGIYYGLRRSELLGLKWDAIDYDKKTIHIQHTVVRVKTTEAKDSTKTINSYRTLKLFTTAEKCLTQIKAEQERNKIFFGNDYHQSDYIFTWEDGRPYNPDYITKLFSKATKAYGRPEITLHKLRHTCASLLINKGWDVKKLQYWLGHSDISTTLNIYSHFNRKRLNETPDDLEDLSKSCANLFG